MTLSEAKTKCESIGMRLPTKEELYFAPELTDQDSYWELNESRPLTWIQNVYNPENNSTTKNIAPVTNKVRCIAGKEFQFKK